MSAQRWHVPLTWIVVGLLSTAGGAERAAGDPLSILGSDPPGGAIDARIPHHPDDGSVLFGWDSIDIALSGDASTQSPADFAVSVDRGGIAPTIIDVTTSGNIATLTLDRAIPPGAWTTFLHVDSGTGVRLGCLPGDVNGDGLSGAVDVLALVDHLNGACPPLPPWSVDIDRSDVEGEADIQALVDLLKGQEAFAVWYGRVLPGTEAGSRSSLRTTGAVIELVPSTPGPYAPGASLTVEVWIHNQESFDIEPRLIQFSTVDTHPGLTFQGPDNWPSGGDGVPEFAFDFSSLDSSALYVSFPNYPYPATVYMGTYSIPGFILELPANGSLRAGQVEVVLPSETEGVYTLDVMNADEADWNWCARLDFDFQNPTTWTACEGLLTGGTLDLVAVGGEPDCNHNGVPDDEDIASGTSTD